jgi:hypothetical protein
MLRANSLVQAGAYIHIYIHTYIHTYMQTYTYICIDYDVESEQFRV